MKTIKCWIAQNTFDKACYVYGKKPKQDKEGNWNSGLYGDILGYNKLQISPTKCVIITEEEYNRLKESEWSIGNET